jgi:hypothetical protein
MNPHHAIKPFVFISLAVIMMLSCAQIGGVEPLPTEAPPLPTAAPTRAAVIPTFPPLLTPTVGAPEPTATLVVAQPNIPGEGDLESRGFVDSGDGKLRVIGKLPMLVTLKSIASPPAAPGGWEFLGPVFDVTAQDKTRKPLQKLAGLVTLRFQAPRGRPVTIMVNDGKSWEIVESEFDSDGNITAAVDHFTNYGVGAPQQSKVTPPATAGTPRVTVTRTQSAATTRTPQVTVAVATSTVSASTAESALSNAAKVLKGKTVKITSAAGYSGSVSVALPASLQKTLSSVSGSGTVYYGLYNGVNEAVTAEAKTASGATSGVMTLLIEPKTSMPTTAADAKTKLQSYFPGVTVTLTQAQPTSTGTTGYVFYGTSGNTTYSLGYVSYNGVALAYAMSGSGTYQSLVPKN